MSTNSSDKIRQLKELEARLTQINRWFNEAPIDEIEAVESAIERNVPMADAEEALATARRLRASLESPALQDRDRALDVLASRVAAISESTPIQEKADFHDIELNLSDALADEPGLSAQVCGAVVDYLTAQTEFLLHGVSVSLKVYASFDVDSDSEIDDDEVLEQSPTAEADRSMQAIDRLVSIKDAEEMWAMWSVGEVPPESLDEEHPYEAHAVLFEANWAHQEDLQVPIAGPTWMDLWRAADFAIRSANEGHYLFIEGFEPLGDGRLRVQLGS